MSPMRRTDALTNRTSRRWSVRSQDNVSIQQPIMLVRTDHNVALVVDSFRNMASTSGRHFVRDVARLDQYVDEVLLRERLTAWLSRGARGRVRRTRTRPRCWPPTFRHGARLPSIPSSRYAGSNHGFRNCPSSRLARLRSAFRQAFSGRRRDEADSTRA